MKTEKEIAIANPIYDVVFKYLMEDTEIAKLILSTIIDEEIESLDFLPQENILTIENRSLTVYRLDFSAKIRLADQSFKQVLIEIQKAKYSTDIMRFRRYLGEQYKKTTGIYYDQEEGKKRVKKRAIPILTIYFLGHKLENFNIPVIKVKRSYINGISDEVLNGKESFIESLTHDSYVIVIPELSSEKQSELEQMLTIFDQTLIISDEHILLIKESEYPERFKPIIRRLHMASASHEIRQKMEAEDEIIEELQALEREIEEKNEALAENKKQLAEKNNALAENKKQLAEKDNALAEKDNALAEKDNALAEKNNALAEQKRIIEKLKEELKH
jgi:molybdopterin converting factor small subunit